MGFIYFYKRHFLVIRCRKKTSRGLLEAVAFEDGKVSFSPWLFWARSSGLILSYFKVLFPALTIARLCQEDFQDVGFHSERVVCRVETASGKAEHSGVARTCFSIVRKDPGWGPATTKSGGGSCVVTLPVQHLKQHHMEPALAFGSPISWLIKLPPFFRHSSSLSSTGDHSIDL